LAAYFFAHFCSTGILCIPVRGDELLSAVERALRRSERVTANSDITKNNRGCFATLNMTIQWGVLERSRMDGNPEIGVLLM
jgi:hypothetical protein